jgi:hypothetical protein
VVLTARLSAPERLGGRYGEAVSGAPRGQQTVAPVGPGPRTDDGRGWTFLTNHGHVLLAIAEDSDIRLRDIADRVGITERAAQLIVSDLERSGYVVKVRLGRRNRYTVVRGQRFRHPAEADKTVDELLAIFGS